MSISNVAAAVIDGPAPPQGICGSLLASIGVPMPPRAGGSAREILASAGIRLRKVQLRLDWHRSSQGAMLARFRGLDAALIPGPFSGYRLVTTEGSHPVTAALAEELEGEAFLLHAPLPPDAREWRALARFATAGSRADLLHIATMATAGALLAVLLPIVTQLMFNNAIPQADIPSILQIGFLLLAAALGSAAFAALQGWAALKMEGRLDPRAQTALFDRLLRLSPRFFKSFTVGDLTTRALSIQRARAIASASAFQVLMGVATGIPSLILLFFYDARLAAVAVLLALFGACALTVIARRQVKAGQAVVENGISGLTLQMLCGMAKLRAGQAEGRAFNVWLSHYAKLLRLRHRELAWGNLTEVFSNTYPLLANLVVYGLAAYFLQQSLAAGDAAKAMSAGTLIAFSTAFGQFMEALTATALSSTQLLSALPHLSRAKPILEAPPEAASLARDAGRLLGGISLNAVSFRYTPETPLVLDRLSLEIPPGSFVAIVGASGSGKSTLLRLLMAFDIPEGGDILYDSQPLATLRAESVRRQIGVVLQHGQVLSGTVLSNIVGASGRGVDEARRAATMAGLDRDIDAMPMGYHTVMQSGGTSLSGGQRQRLLIARALINNPALLLLDEASSALDNVTQSLVMDTLATLPATRIMVAHRLSTIRRADRILVMERGRLVEDGTFDDLIRKGGAFARLAQRQQL
ncbi:ATP-binding cassette domain-containing protein (plasmid) [Ensifer sp. PDNC004]|uniref:ATP-binding cassette domain-containing protein n=1 Tax=Ensifer sp. PDNC004 TaxID=2811423 RepID=UPI0019657B28|nr:ATP-binding cassette domain-containing protein [Ensifer sp. PDNC004]QRY70613.1 ATP-binding cassette domain-containing protein [Ensifer sp. PDNC004]